MCTKEGAWVRSKNCAFFQLSNSQIVSSEVLIFCVEFQELSHLTRDLSQAEKKIKCCYKLSKCTKWHLFYSKLLKLSFCMKIVVIVSVAQLVTPVIFFSAWDKSRVKWDNSWNSTQKMRTFSLFHLKDHIRIHTQFLVVFTRSWSNH